jgi:hypothetical protein
LQIADQGGRVDLFRPAFTNDARPVADQRFPFPGNLDAQVFQAGVEGFGDVAFIQVLVLADYVPGL